MATTYYNLPTITPATVANGPDAINGLANATDAAIHSVEAKIPESTDISGISEKAEAAAVNAQAALNSAAQANNTATSAAQTASTAVSTANGASSAAATANAGVSALEIRMTDVEKLLDFVTYTDPTFTRSGMYDIVQHEFRQTGVNGATFSKSSSTEMHVAATESGAFAKIYGRVIGTMSGTRGSTEACVVGFPLASAGIATPTQSFTVAYAGLRYVNGLGSTSIHFNADGYCYVEGVTGQTTAQTAYYTPFIIQVKNFGDTAE